MNSLQELKVAQNEYTEALVRLAIAKYNLEGEKTIQIIQGIEGKNQAERDARLRDNLEAEYREEYKANIGIIEKRGAFENASRQFEFDQIAAQI